MKTKTIRQTATLKASPEEVYELLMDSRKHSKFSGGKASISNKVGGNFSAYDGYCSGKNLELVPDKKIVQSWRASEWEEGHFSKAIFSLAKTKTGTKLTFTQSGVPPQHYKSIKQGWIDFYWNPMKIFLEK